MAIVGGAALSPWMGLINDGDYSIALACLFPLAAYIVVGVYAYSDARERGSRDHGRMESGR